MENIENQINIAKEIADLAIEDGQMQRPFHNLFNEIYDEIKSREFSFEGHSFTDRIEFLKFMAGVAYDAVKITEAWKDDEPESYLNEN